jgi:hypothetical protein
MKQILLFLSVLFNVSCQKPTLEVRVAQQKAPFYFRFEVKDTILEDYQYVDYTLGDSIWVSDFRDTSYHYLTWRNELEDINGIYYFQTGLSDMRFGSPFTESIFGFGFSIPGLEPGKIPTQEMVEGFFYPGRTIPFGLGPEKVNALLRLPIGNPAFLLPSQTVFLYEPYGELNIKKIEEYTMQYRSSPEEVLRGKRITCVFEGGIGIYVPQPSVDAVSYTDVAIDLRNGEAVFFIPYE